MFAESEFGAQRFGASQATTSPTPASTTYQRLVVPCGRAECPTQNDFGIYSLQDDIPSRMVSATACPVATCTQAPDIEIYSLQDRILFNGTPLITVPICPEGHTCPPGTLPDEVVYPPGTFVIPDPNFNNSFPIIISMVGCLSTVTRVLPSTATQAQINAAAQEVFLEVANQRTYCDIVNNYNPPPKITVYYNEVVYFVHTCAEGETLTYSGTLPSYITLDTANSRLVLAAGTYAATTQAIANSTAQAELNNFGNAALTSGDLSCVAPPTGCSFWSGMTWDTVTDFGNSVTTAVGEVINNTALGDTFGPSAGVFIHGSLNYTGPEIDCSLTIDMARTGNGSAGLIIVQDGNPILTLVDTGIPNGNSVHPFTVAAGVASVLEFYGNDGVPTLLTLASDTADTVTITITLG